ncbi:MAG: F0F1 ATP synthase subunit B, partial [Armatimonadetes bacterium]|nr:F0F1 ATP synthase subunit B [Armatimonadota bacterium]
RFLFKPLSGVMEARTAKIEKDISEAEILKQEAQELKDEYTAKIDASRKEAQKIIQDSTFHGERAKADIIAEAKREAGKVLEDAQREVEWQKQKALEDIKTQTVGLAVAAAGRIIENSLDRKTQEALITEFLKRVERSRAN